MGEIRSFAVNAIVATAALFAALSAAFAVVFGTMWAFVTVFGNDPISVFFAACLLVSAAIGVAFACSESKKP